MNRFALMLLALCASSTALAATPSNKVRPSEIRVQLNQNQLALNHRIEFKLDSDKLTRGSRRVLDAVAQTLRDNPRLFIEVSGHTDAQGPESYNLELSQARAESVVRYLTQRGVNAIRLTARGYGESRPLRKGDSELVYKTNRRVEFHIVPPARAKAPRIPPPSAASRKG